VIIGHKKIQDFFKKAIENDKLAHAYCFSGIESLGKKALALELAAEFLETTVDKLEKNADFVLLGRVIDQKTEKMKKEISIEQVRELKSFLQNFSWGKVGRKIVVINEAEKLSLGASNSLLKLLEEPGQGVHFFLITTNSDLLLETIKSRCQTFYFSVVGKEELLTGLVNQGFNKEGLAEATDLSCGVPGTAIKILKDESCKREFLEKQQQFGLIVNGEIQRRFQIAEELVKRGKETGEAEVDIEADMDSWIRESRKVIINALVSGSQAEVKKNFKFIDLALQAKKHLKQNVNQKLILENIFLNIN